MSTYGTKTRQYLSVSFFTRWSSEDYLPPGIPTHELRVNGAYVQVEFRLPRRGGRSWLKLWRFGDGVISTPFCFVIYGVDGPLGVETYQSDEYPG